MQVHGGGEQHVDALAPASCASSLPIASTRSQSQVAASAVGDGTLADVSRSSQVSPRTPAGPSEVTSLRSPAPGAAYSAQKSAPVSSWTFCGRERPATRRRSSTSLDRTGSHVLSVMAWAG